MDLCQCCRAAFTSVTIRSLFEDEGEAWSLGVCPSCFRWLSNNVAAARDGAPRLVAAPSPNGRDLLFDDQCRICRRMSEGPPLRIECLLEGGGRLPFPALRLCVSCDAWLACIARDGRSARNLAAREIDGEYGNWLHPNLRSLSVAVDIADGAARTAVFEYCARMSIRAGLAREVETPSVILREVPSRAARRRGAKRDVPLVLLAPFGARYDLHAALGPNVVDWLTIPVTPQQVAAALTRVLLAAGRSQEWDYRFALPVLASLDPMPPALTVRPARGVDRLELAWLLRRFSRGYDTLGVLGGRLLLIPRVPASRLPAVARRLRAVLGGRAALTPLAPASYAPRLHASR